MAFSHLCRRREVKWMRRSDERQCGDSGGMPVDPHRRSGRREIAVHITERDRAECRRDGCTGDESDLALAGKYLGTAKVVPYVVGGVPCVLILRWLQPDADQLFRHAAAATMHHADDHFLTDV